MQSNVIEIIATVIMSINCFGCNANTGVPIDHLVSLDEHKGVDITKLSIANFENVRCVQSRVGLCWAACVKIILKCEGKTISEDELIDAGAGFNSIIGSNSIDLAMLDYVFDDFGLKHEICDSIELNFSRDDCSDRIISSIRALRPPLVVVRIGNNLHARLIVGVWFTEIGGRRKIVGVRSFDPDVRLDPTGVFMWTSADRFFRECVFVVSK